MTSRSVLLLCAACGGAGAPEATADAGQPVPGLDAVAMREFVEGRALFHRAYGPEEGLGPIFNQNRCSSCHDIPAIGGHGIESVRKATRFEHGQCMLLEDSGGAMVQQQATPALRATGFLAEALPRSATATTRITPPSLYGAGLIEAIDSAAIARNADPDDVDGDGISGRIGIAADGRFARYGRKANFADLRAFVEDALVQEMGLTTAAHPNEQKPNGHALPAGTDPAPDPEIDDATVALLTQYIRLLAAPARATPTTRELADTIARGERVFARIGCTSCHTPSFETGTSSVAALSNRRVQLYSDMLLHDMGEAMATICSENAAPGEWRTAPLMGLRFRHRLMHDGSAQTLPAAILAHGGEAQAARMRFERLGEADRAALLRFLRAL